ncbi:hypothetical protein Efla_001991 [Eimeria flavescens]
MQPERPRLLCVSVACLGFCLSPYRCLPACSLRGRASSECLLPASASACLPSRRAASGLSRSTLAAPLQQQQPACCLQQAEPSPPSGPKAARWRPRAGVVSWLSSWRALCDSQDAAAAHQLQQVCGAAAGDLTATSRPLLSLLLAGRVASKAARGLRRLQTGRPLRGSKSEASPLRSAAGPGPPHCVSPLLAEAVDCLVLPAKGQSPAWPLSQVLNTTPHAKGEERETGGPLEQSREDGGRRQRPRGPRCATRAADAGEGPRPQGAATRRRDDWHRRMRRQPVGDLAERSEMGRRGGESGRLPVVASDREGASCVASASPSSSLSELHALSSSLSLHKYTPVFLVERLDALPSGSFEHLITVCFLRPTSENVLLLLRLLQQEQQGPEADSPLLPGGAPSAASRRRFKELHLFFSAALQRQSEMLRRLALQDEADLIAQVFELFVDVYALGPHLFCLNIPAVSQLQLQNLSLWTAYDESLFQRMVDGVFSCIALLGGAPLIRFHRGSAVCQRLAAATQHRLDESRAFAQQQGQQPHEAVAAAAPTGRLVLLLFDRREDPVTPLLNQWTYTAMVHELLSIRRNRVDLQKVPNISDDLKEVVLSTTQDEFYKTHCFSNFGDLGVAVKQHLNEYQEKASAPCCLVLLLLQTKTHAQIASLEAIRDFLDQYPECRKMSGSVFKHVTIIHELSRLVQERQLLRVSEVEQDLATREARNEHLKTVLQLLRDADITNMDKLRLRAFLDSASLFVIFLVGRYEGDPSVESLKGELRRAGVDAEEVLLVDALTQYSSAANRSGDLLQNKTFLAVAKSSIAKGLQGVTNVYTQHKSLLYSVVDSLIRGKLKETTYPLLTAHQPGGALSSSASPKEKLQTVVVFVVGGATYEEERDMDELSRATGVTVILGGSTMLNSRSFLADVSQLIRGHSLSASVLIPTGWKQ